jgi:hypothetical protein
MEEILVAIFPSIVGFCGLENGSKHHSCPSMSDDDIMAVFNEAGT